MMAWRRGLTALLILTGLAAPASLLANPFEHLDLERMLPVRTQEMRSGIAETKNLASRLPRPLFLIGTDRRSLVWLKAHHEKLRQLNAVGLVVEAESVPALKKIMAAAHGILLVPASASDIASALELTHYPVLLIEDRAEP